MMEFINYKAKIEEFNERIIYLTMNFTTEDYFNSRVDRDWEKYDNYPTDMEGSYYRLLVRLKEISEYVGSK